MEMNRYQEQAHETAVYPHRDVTQTLSYCALGLAGEAGEVANEIKKVIRDDDGNLTPDRYWTLIKEMGDCLWYLAELCTVMPSPTSIDIVWATTLDLVAQENLNKLKLRKHLNVLRGSGSEREDCGENRT